MRNILIILFLFAVVLSPQCFADVSNRNYALEIKYGASDTTFLPLKESGSVIYGDMLFLNPTSVKVIWSAFPSVNIGFSFSGASRNEKKSYLADGGVYMNPSLNVVSVNPFIDLTPFAATDENGRGITKGFFIEAGPSWTSVLEEYSLNGNDEAFSSTALFLDVKIGLRTMTREPLSFTVELDALIPMYSDGRRSDTGLTLNGAASISASAGICLSI
jgi:hypothetical protein